MSRHDQRLADQLRDIQFIPNFAPNALGSVLVCFGNTRVICTATVDERVPRWMMVQKVKGGWMTAEYSMLPYSTLERKDRDISRGKLDGRSQEIQRLIGRSLRAVVDLKGLGQRTLWIDCDVLQADGGTRTASITGACVALNIAVNQLIAKGKLKSSPLKEMVAAVSAGVVNGEPVLDLDYVEDKGATVDFNVVMTESGEFVEIQGAGEEATYSRQEMNAMLDLAEEGIKTLIEKQKEAVAAAEGARLNDSLSDLADHFKA